MTVVVDGRPFEVTTLAPGRRDLRPPRQGRVRPRLEGRRRAARLHHERALASRRRHGATITSAASPISRRGACASSAMRPRASPRITCASCASSASTPPMAKARPTPRGLHACIAGARRSRSIVARAGAHGTAQTARCAPHAVPTLAIMAETGLLLTVLGGVPHARGFRQHDQARSRDRCRSPTRCAGSARSAVFVIEDAERLWQRLRLANAEHARLTSMGDGWSAHSSGRGRTGGARAALPARPGALSRPRACSPGRARRRAPPIAAWRSLATLPQRWTAPVFPLKAADFMEHGVAKGPQLGAAMRAAENAWIAADFPDDAQSLQTIAIRVVTART